jgi:mono/diheme cytochrome c family protein
VSRGRYLAAVADCGGCHSPEGGAPYSGGTSIDTPFGKIRATNLTPDHDTGIGAWSDEEFVNAVRRGISRGGSHLYPAMPYPYYTRMTAEEVLAIRAYLATLPPVPHVIDRNTLPFPFKIRGLLAAWNAINFREGTYTADPGHSSEWNRGAYLVEGPGHCGACHTPKGPLGGDKNALDLAGGTEGGWVTPDLRPDARRGLDGWTVEDVVAYLRAGTNWYAAASGPMAEVVEKSTSELTHADARAISVYLLSLNRIDSPSIAVTASGDARWNAGAQIYGDACASCHGARGGGLKPLFPRLNGSPIVQAPDPASLIHVVLHGTQSAATPLAPTGPSMPAFGWELDDEAVANVLTYIRNAWGNAGSVVSTAAVRKDRDARGAGS